MIISHSKKFIFIHIYKVAGSSIFNVLNNYESLFRRIKRKAYKKFNKNAYPHHLKIIELKKILPENIFNNYYKFAFVRNPWDWQVSLYHFMLQQKAHFQHEFIRELKSFEEYINWRINNDLNLQSEFIYGPKEELLVDFVGKYEDLQKDFDKVCGKIGINKIKLPSINKSRHKPYQEYYNSRTKKLVYDAFRKDIELFGYEMW